MSINQNQIDQISSPATTPQRADPVSLQFLKEFPAWCILFVLIVLFLTMYHFTREDFIPRIIDGLVGAMLTAIVAQRPRSSQAPPTTSITTDTVETPAVNAQTIENSVVNAESLNVEKNPKENTDV